MAWKRQSTTTSVDVDLIDFRGEELLQQLINDKWISPEEAEAICERARHLERNIKLDSTMDYDELAVARHDLSVGRHQEALIHLERFLGRDWVGVLT